MRRILFAWLLLFACGAAAQSGDILGVHDLSSAANPIKGTMSAACLYCHAPHSGASKGPLWSQTFSSQTYTQLYSSDTVQNTTVQPTVGDASSLCLSCHDGTVAPGQMVPYGTVTLSQPMTNGLLPHLEASHPFSMKLPMKDASTLVDTLVATGQTADTTHSVRLIKGNIECSSCHNPHMQAVDKQSPNFLVRDNAKAGLCLSCHETKPRIVNSISNPLMQWTTSVHATSAAVVNPGSGLGGYTTVADFACTSCHASHNAGGAAGLLRNPVPAVPNIDSTSQSCLLCHNGSNKLLQPIANVFGEFDKKGGHPFALGSNIHTATEPVVLNQNRHATCVDCHNGHASNQVLAFNAAPDIRPSQSGVAGIAADGSTLTGPATKQYETCLRCHGNSTGKQILTDKYGYLPSRAVFGSDPLNLIQQFGATAISSHPVMRDATGISQPSLLAAMWDITGRVQMRPMGTRIFCTDCHNSDDNREFGGTGPSGPHGSNNDHILERPYLISQVTPGAWPTAGPGTPIVNLNTNMSTDPGNSPFALCAKCHDLNSIMSNASFPGHNEHIGTGFSCSVCHSGHGVPAGGSGTISGQRLVNFDINVVRPYNGVLSYSNGTCTLTCHGKDHNALGN